MKLFKKNQILTLPNLLSLFRLLLIPVIIWLYFPGDDHYLAAAVILLSGATDVADGIIARKFNMVSDFGKILDPIADKLTQIALLVCLSYKYPLMLVLIVLFVLKECTMAALGAINIKKQQAVNSAKWHGKLNTIVLYGSMLLMIVFPELPKSFVNTMICLCIISMSCSLLLYTRFYILSWKKSTDNKSEIQKPQLTR